MGSTNSSWKRKCNCSLLAIDMFAANALLLDMPLEKTFVWKNRLQRIYEAGIVGYLMMLTEASFTQCLASRKH